MKKLVIAWMVILCGCDKPEVQMCEAFIKSDLKAPATYQRISYSARQHHFSTWPEYRRFTGDYQNTLYQLAHHGEEDPSGPYLKTVTIDYDAQNGFGVPLRGSETCGFSRRFDRSTGSQALGSLILGAAERTRDLKKIDDNVGVEKSDDPRGVFPCCIG